VSPPTAGPTADFESTIDIQYRVLYSRVFPVKKGGLQITLSADWSPSGVDRPGVLYPPPAEYSVTLERKGWPFDDQVKTFTFPTGTEMLWVGTGLEEGNYQLIFFVGDHDPSFRLTGNVSVTTFDAH
jgi:hypothetical protein